MITLTTQQAKDAGMRILAGAYSERENWMLESASRQLGSIVHAYVQGAAGIELWRTGIGWVEKSEARP